MNPESNKKYDDTIRLELEKRLKRQPTENELKNADTDVDLVSEVLWQMINDLYNEVAKLKQKP